MSSGNDEPDGELDDLEDTGTDLRRDPELNSYAEDAAVSTPHSSAFYELSQFSPALQHRPKISPEKEADMRLRSDIGGVQMEKVILEVRVPLPERPWEYLRMPEEDIVEAVIEEAERSDDELWYRIEFEDGREANVSFDGLLSLPKGPAALEFFNRGGTSPERSQADMDHEREDYSSDRSAVSSFTRKRARFRFTSRGLADDEENAVGFENDEDFVYVAKRQRTNKPRTSYRTAKLSQKNSMEESLKIVSILPDNDLSDDEPEGSRAGLRRSTRNLRPNYANKVAMDKNNGSASPSGSKRRGSSRASADSEEFEEFTTDRYERNDKIFYKAPKAKSKRLHIGKARGRPTEDMARPRQMKRGRKTFNGRHRSSSSYDERPEPTRRSDRTNKATKNMRELGEDEEMFAEDIAKDKRPQVINIQEIFKPLSLKSHFRVIHNKYCDTCGGYQENSNKGPSPLIYCQGCSTSIHRVCLGARSAREHIVTKVGDQDFVMQCRRCIGIATKKDFTAPRLDICQTCRLPGEACEAFSQRRTLKQEEKLRKENDGIDPITSIDAALLGNPAILLFRCINCHRGFHFEHLPPLSDNATELDNIEDIRDFRYAEYSQTWQCRDCQDVPGKVQTLVAWRPSNIDNYIPGQPFDLVSDDDKEYLIKWEDLSYFRCTWMPGAWVWATTTSATRIAFARRNEGVNSHPRMSQDDAIPEEFLRMEIVLDVKYSSHVGTQTEEIDKARVTEVEQVFVKFQGLGYDEVVWEHPPKLNETERWNDFVAAYNEYVAGKYFRPPHAKMTEHIKEYRAMDFNKNLLLQDQPACLTGGTMMEYQMEGVNWLLYNYHQGKNVVLADEMGLGKTIQVIAAIATLVKEKPKCWPFLVVVPNSTCPNWRREIKKWAPSLRVVAFYGLKKARDVAMEYELYPDGSSDMRAHVVVTSFDAPVDDHSKSFFKKVKWAGLIVDEGQRLKNDKNLLYGALSALKVPFKVLLTGTPLQNNKRELFNLLQFLDTSLDAAQLDEKFANLTNEDLTHLHKLIRPFFLRRTKVQVLKFLPPMAQVIVPVTMSVVQKKLYKSILARSPELIHSIFHKNQAQLRLSECSNLNNILIQLRKVLCHPFIYSQAIEERTACQTISHRNLVDASAKLQLLEIMLPKLHERGHRVLIFSQFLMQLDIVEDFLDGLGLGFQRLDGNVGTLEKQKRIDAFNAPNSNLFAFLLSTRAGGVGINLATADTVIIMDPDFNPHQDIQALSRAHRIGQKKKVLVFQLMTKDSAEEKIVQIGRKKMALDHVLIESMDLDDDAGVDLQSILQHGAQALFNDDDSNDIRYDSPSVDKLLDRSQVENTSIGDDKSAESQFSYARIWANNIGTLTDDIGDTGPDASAPNSGLWDKILKQREADAAREATAQQKLFGRGRRKRQNVDYQSSNLEIEELGPSPDKSRTARIVDADSDTDFAAAIESGVDDDYQAPSFGVASPQVQRTRERRIVDKSGPLPTQVRQGMAKNKPLPSQKSNEESSSGEKPAPALKKTTPSRTAPTKGGTPPAKFIKSRSCDTALLLAGKSSVYKIGPFRRAKLAKPVPSPSFLEADQKEADILSFSQEALQTRYCHACGETHVTGFCAMKRTGVEHCELCGIAHFGGTDNCANLKSEKQVRLMLDALKTSTEAREDIELARTQLRVRIHDLVQEKKQRRASLGSVTGSILSLPPRV